VGVLGTYRKDDRGRGEKKVDKKRGGEGGGGGRKGEKDKMVRKKAGWG